MKRLLTCLKTLVASLILDREKNSQASAAEETLGRSPSVGRRKFARVPERKHDQRATCRSRPPRDRLVQKDPEAAFRWSESVQNEVERRQLMGDSAMSWLRTDPQKARAALQASDLPEEQKRALLQVTP